MAVTFSVADYPHELNLCKANHDHLMEALDVSSLGMEANLERGWIIIPPGKLLDAVDRVRRGLDAHPTEFEKEGIDARQMRTYLNTLERLAKAARERRCPVEVELM